MEEIPVTKRATFSLENLFTKENAIIHVTSDTIIGDTLSLIRISRKGTCAVICVIIE
jgi:hypothetical protein